jgi:hypothetical protein
MKVIGNTNLIAGERDVWASGDERPWQRPRLTLAICLRCVLPAVAALTTLVIHAPAASAPACVDPPEVRTKASFDEWLLRHPSEVPKFDAFKRTLDDAGVGGLIPMHLLARTASRWSVCRSAQPYAVPPSQLQARTVLTLQLAKALKELDLLPTGDVASVYRDEGLNGCACGTSGSQHLLGAAIDFYPSNDFGENKRRALCKFWREQGDKWKMGISQYPSNRIHIDTNPAKGRKRTWTVKGATPVCAN